jgi:UPF0755 protein
VRTFIALLLLAVVCAAAVAVDCWRSLQRPLLIDREAELLIEPGTPFAAVVAGFVEQGWLPAQPRSAWYLRAYGRWSGLATQLKAGEYRLQPGASAITALRLLASGQSILHELRLIEGWTFRQALDAVRAHPMLRQTLVGDDNAALIAALDLHADHPEGRLFPDTYRFARGTTDVAFLRRAADTLQRVLAEEWATRADGLPYATADEALIMASIIEKETGAAHERPQIAGVFVRRLRPGMRLQTDPTVIYGLGAAFDGNLRRSDLSADTAYNTYTRAGLPPSPICLAGRASIRAALHPAPGTTLYFVSRGDGTHVFSDTLEQHNAAVQQYQLRKR